MVISQLQYFATVAQFENVSRAAELLHISQSALSKNIAKLEEELGTPLFERSGKKITLNAPGRRFLEYCTQTLREMDMVMEDIQQMTHGADKRIRIGTAGLNHRMISCMAAFRQEHPDIEFDLFSSIESLESLDINEYDLLVYPKGRQYDRFTGYAFYEERYFLAVPAGSELVKNVSVSAKLLNGLDFVFLRRSKTSLEYPYTICTALAVDFGAQHFVDSRELHRQMIAAGMAVGFVAEEEVTLYQGAPDIRLIPILDQRFSRHMMLCFKRNKHLSESGLAFRSFVMDYFSLQTAT